MDGRTDDRQIRLEEEVASDQVRGKQNPNCRRPYLKCSPAVNHCKDLEEMLKSFKQKKGKGNGLRFRKFIPAAVRGAGSGSGELRGRATIRGPSLTGEKRGDGEEQTVPRDVSEAKSLAPNSDLGDRKMGESGVITELAHGGLGPRW